MMQHIIYVLENESPVFRLAVWGLRQEGYEVMSVPEPAEWIRATETPPRYVVINWVQPVEERRELVKEIRAHFPDALILDLGHHDIAETGADHQLDPPYRIEDIVEWLEGSTESVAG
jgi:DNA-binding response OmpR family regulator